MRDMMTEMHHHAIEQRGEHENPECKLCHIEAVKDKDIDCSPPCATCREEGQHGYEMAHDL